MSRISLSNLKAQERLVESQRRKATLASLVIAVLVIVLLMLVLTLVLLPSLTREQPVIVSYSASQTSEDPVETRKVQQTLKKPSAPSSASAKVIAANVAAPTSIPVPEIHVEDVSFEFGSGDDFGDGWDDGDMSGLAGGTTFFKQKVSAQRVAYVIDYSASMRGEREKLMRAELAKSIKGLSPGMKFQMIFFCGPAWAAGSKVSVETNAERGEVTQDDKVFKWRGKGPHEWRPSGRKQDPEWLDLTSGTLDAALGHIKDTPLAWGTDWEPALEMAMDMNPPPQIIFFMTDGAVQGDMVKLAEKLGRRAKSRGIVINTVAMMEPRTEEAMKELAKRTEGQFSIVRSGGEVEIVPTE